MLGRMSDLLNWLRRDQTEPRMDEHTLATAGEITPDTVSAVAQGWPLVPSHQAYVKPHPQSAAPATNPPRVATCQELGMVEGQSHAQCNNGYRAPETIKVRRWGKTFTGLTGPYQTILACSWCHTMCVDASEGQNKAPLSGDRPACGILDVGDDCPRCGAVLDGAWECIDVVRCVGCGWMCRDR